MEEISVGYQGTVNQMTHYQHTLSTYTINIHYQHTLSKKLVQHIGGVPSCYNRNRPTVPVFYGVNKTWVRVRVRMN